MPGLFSLTENILVTPPLFGVPELDQEPESYKKEIFPQKRELPEIMENSIIEHTEIYKKVC